jgi:Domain of unknown function (DUF1905)
MQERSFTGVVQAGHKEHAVEVPFNPSELWGRGPERFAPGRRGVVVRGRIHGVEFTSHVVSRSGKHWLLLPPEVERALGVQVGGEASVSLSVSNAVA